MNDIEKKYLWVTIWIILNGIPAMGEDCFPTERNITNKLAQFLNQ